MRPGGNSDLEAAQFIQINTLWITFFDHDNCAGIMHVDKIHPFAALWRIMKIRSVISVTKHPLDNAGKSSLLCDTLKPQALSDSMLKIQHITCHLALLIYKITRRILRVIYPDKLIAILLRHLGLQLLVHIGCMGSRYQDCGSCKYRHQCHCLKSFFKDLHDSLQK